MHASWETAALLLALAVLLDWFAGEYPHVLHPVVWMGHTVNMLLSPWRAGSISDRSTQPSAETPVASTPVADAPGSPGVSWWPQFLYGIALVAFMCGLTGTLAYLVMRWARANFVIEIIVGTLLLKSSFALHELGRAAFRVAEPLEKNDLPRARIALRSLCSRDATNLQTKELIAGTVESLAENASDSFVAPLFYYLLLGLPGALVYRVINTMDAMIGYRGKYEALGKAAARLDDVANWVPARLTALLLLLAGALRGCSLADGWRILRRDGGKTASPNAGRPMAAMAGLLGVQLEKRNAYTLGDEKVELTTDKIGQTWRIVVLAGLLLLVGALVVLDLLRRSGFRS